MSKQQNVVEAMQTSPTSQLLLLQNGSERQWIVVDLLHHLPDIKCMWLLTRKYKVQKFKLMDLFSSFLSLRDLTGDTVSHSTHVHT